MTPSNAIYPLCTKNVPHPPHVPSVEGVEGVEGLKVSAASSLHGLSEHI